MIDEKQVNMVLNHPMFIPGLAVVGGVLFMLVLLKLLVGPKTLDTEDNKEEGRRAMLGKRKKAKKQKLQEKKASGSPKAKKETRKSGVASVVETSKTSVEETKSEKKKEGKSKTKSKKKKNTPAKPESIATSEAVDAGADAGEWQTVSTKEQREQQKREKKKENVAVSVEAEEEKPKPLVPPALKPAANISAIAKGIAPRFARAAGEQWQGKPAMQTGGLQPKRPMPPATVPGAENQASKPSWVPGPQEKQIWPTDIGGPWPNMQPPTTTGGLTSDFWSPDSSSLLSMAATGDKGVMPGWPQGGNTWQAGNGAANGTWAEEWVHVNAAQNGRNLNANNGTWSGNGSPLRSQPQVHKKEEEWTLEPEGFPIEPAQLDPNDPWNIEVIGTADAGDWAAPSSTWVNTNEEWKAPAPVKQIPTYIDESSDEDNYSAKVTPRSGASNQQNNSSSGMMTSPQSIVGAGPDFMSQSAPQGQSKKSRRRRKKKQPTGEAENSTSLSPQQSMDEPEATKPDSPTAVTTPKKQATIKKDQEQVTKVEVEPRQEQQSKAETTTETKDEWTTQKTSKKRKPKARKAD